MNIIKNTRNGKSLWVKNIFPPWNYMFSHRFKMYDALGAVVSHDWRRHVQHFWNWRVELPHKIDIPRNALNLAEYLSCFATTYIIRLNLSRPANWCNCLKQSSNEIMRWKTFVAINFSLHCISKSAWLLSPSPSELLAMHVYKPICDLLTFVITKLWFEIIIPSLNVFAKSFPYSNE